MDCVFIIGAWFICGGFAASFNMIMTKAEMGKWGPLDEIATVLNIAFGPVALLAQTIRFFIVHCGDQEETKK